MRIAEQPDILRLEAQRQPEADEAPCDHRERERHENENRPPDELETVSNPIQQVEQTLLVRFVFFLRRLVDLLPSFVPRLAMLLPVVLSLHEAHPCLPSIRQIR